MNQATPISSGETAPPRITLAADTLNELLDMLFTGTGIRCTVLDADGNTIVAKEPRNRFCAYIYENYSTNNNESICHSCAVMAAKHAVNSDAPFHYRCHMNLCCTLIPIRGDRQNIMYLLFSGYRINSEQLNALPMIKPDIEVLPKVIWQNPNQTDAPYLSFQRLQEIIHTLTIAGRYIAEAEAKLQAQSKLYLQNYELMASANARTQAEFQALRAQINPHFLFNVLNTVVQLAIIEDSPETEKALYGLSAVLRRSLKRSTAPVVPLSEELSFLREYISLKNLMLQNRIQISIKAEEECLNLKVPPFTLQPLVENAFLHGVEPKEEGGSISVEISQDGDKTIISVSDTGCGISDEKLKQLQHINTTPTRSELSGLGLHNVIAQMQACFGDAFSWTIKSREGIYTKVSLEIQNL